MICRDRPHESWAMTDPMTDLKTDTITVPMTDLLTFCFYCFYQHLWFVNLSGQLRTLLSLLNNKAQISILADLSKIPSMSKRAPTHWPRGDPSPRSSLLPIAMKTMLLPMKTMPRGSNVPHLGIIAVIGIIFNTITETLIWHNFHRPYWCC